MHAVLRAMQSTRESLDAFFTRVEPPRMSWPLRDVDFQRMLAGEIEWDDVEGLSKAAEFEAMAPAFDRLSRVVERGTAFTPEFFGILWQGDDDSFDPRPSNARQWARVLQMDALRLIRAGRDDEAADRYALMYRIDDRLIESESSLYSLVGAALRIDQKILEQIRTIRGTVPEPVRATIFEQLMQRKPRDPAGYRAAAIADARRQIKEIRRELIIKGHGRGLYQAMHRNAVEYREPQAKHFMPQPNVDRRVWEFVAPKGGTKQYRILQWLSLERLERQLASAERWLDAWEAEDPGSLTEERIAAYLDAIYMDGTQFTRVVIAPQLTGFSLNHGLASEHGKLLIELQPRPER